MRTAVGLLLGISVSLINSGCNFFAPIDTPAGDAQILSKARACFDLGDYDCATRYYSSLSSASIDQASSESAFELLAQNGVSVSVFMNAVITGSSSGGKLVTALANALTGKASATTRLAIFHAYQKNSSIGDTRIRGLIRFITAITLMAELLAEDAGTDGVLQQTDLVKTPTACLAAPSPPLGYVLSADCTKPVGKTLISGTAITLATATDTQMSGSPSLQMINAAASEVGAGISQMQATGSLGSASSTFSTNLLAAALDTGDSPAYRAALILYEIGGQ